MSFITPDHIRAHRHSIRHRDEIDASGVCGCFYCLAIFQPNDIKGWVDQTELSPAGATALCPRCGIDSVIGSASGYPITEPFLRDMRSHWFNTP